MRHLWCDGPTRGAYGEDVQVTDFVDCLVLLRHAPLRMKVIKPGVSRMDSPNEEVFITPKPELAVGTNELNFPVRYS